MPAAGVFTTNLATAAPVQVSRAHLAATGGRASAVVLNSGNANAATGPPGLDDAERMCAAGRRARVPTRGGARVLHRADRHPAADRRVIRTAIPDLVAGRSGAPTAASAAAQAIMTTDTAPQGGRRGGAGFVVGGMAKGAAMLAPNMATMLAVLTTDAAVDAGPAAGRAARPAVDDCSTRCRSTGARRPTTPCSLLASGAAGAPDRSGVRRGPGRRCAPTWPSRWRPTPRAPPRSCTVRVVGAAVDRRGPPGRPQGGREPAGAVLALRRGPLLGPDRQRARHRPASPSTPTACRVSYGGIERVPPAASPPATTTRPRSAATWPAAPVEIIADLGLGDGTAVVLTTDLTHGYIDENMRTS